MITKKNSKMLVQPEPLPISEQQSKITTSCPASGNTFVIGSQSTVFTKITLDKRELLEILFDITYGELKGGPILSEEEYKKHKDWSIGSGFFEYQLCVKFYHTNEK
jgi:hypothetical protein